MKISNEFGFCEYSFEHDIIGEFVHIYNLYVYPKYRKQGHATKLLEKTIKTIKNIGHTGDILIVADPIDCSISKEKLKQFYQKFGLVVFDGYIKP